MCTNEGFGDRAIRLMLGSVLVTLAATGHGLWGWFGILQIATGLTGYCVLYEPFRLDTNKWPPRRPAARSARSAARGSEAGSAPDHLRHVSGVA